MAKTETADSRVAARNEVLEKIAELAERSARNVREATQIRLEFLANLNLLESLPRPSEKSA